MLNMIFCTENIKKQHVYSLKLKKKTLTLFYEKHFFNNPVIKYPFQVLL